MEHIIAKLLQDFEKGHINRRQLIQSLALAATAASALGGAQLAGVTTVTAAALQLTAEHLQPAFEAVVEAVTRRTVPSPAWFSQARRNAEARQAFLDEFGAVTSEQIASLASSHATNRRATAHRWQKERKIFAVNHHGQILYPGFQFDPETGRPKKAIAQVLGALPDALTGWALALWWTTPVDLLDWARPVDRLEATPADVIRAATTEAADWAQSA